MPDFKQTWDEVSEMKMVSKTDDLLTLKYSASGYSGGAHGYYFENYKTFDDYSDEQLEIIIADEERKIVDDLKTKSLVVALAALGLNFFI